MASGPSPATTSCWLGSMHVTSGFTPEKVSLLLPVYTITDVPGSYTEQRTSPLCLPRACPPISVSAHRYDRRFSSSMASSASRTTSRTIWAAGLMSCTRLHDSPA